MNTKNEDTGTRPRIYVASLSDYNAGTLHGRWIFADDGAEEIHQQVVEMLAASEEEVAEEWAIHDYEGFGCLRLSEYENLEKVAELGSLMSEYGEIFASLVAHFGGAEYVDEATRYMEEGYCGSFERLEDYARDFVEGCYGTEIEKLPEFIRYNIDYEAIARDMELSGDVFTIEHARQVHVFHGNI